MIEIERKFLVKNTAYKTAAHSHTQIIQGYLNTDPLRTVRIRIKNQTGFITIKGKSNASGTTRFEWEKEIPYQEAMALIPLCEEGTIEKTRYLIKTGKHTIEVDEFHGVNKGLILAEIELDSENESFSKPDWLGQEVTGDKRYYNSYLSKNPFTHW